MTKLAPLFMVGSAALIFLLGLLQLLYALRGSQLIPREADLQQRMASVAPEIARETTMWKLWIGFNAGNAAGGMFFGLVYAYLAFAHTAFFFDSTFLLVVGFVLLGSYLFFSMRYWFGTAFRGVMLAIILYAFSLISAAVWGI